MSGSVRWGVAGCGWVARDYVVPAIAGAPNAELAALLDPDPGALRRVAAGHREAAAHTALDDFLAVPGLDAVYVAAPNHLHRPLTEAAAAAGKHVLCEKPMATTVADAEAMVAACERARVRYATAFDQRFHGAHRRLGALVAEGALGTVTSARIHYACWLSPDWAEDNWRIDVARAGGGALIDLAPHGLDLLVTVLGEPLEHVTALTQRRVFDYPVEDGAALVARSRSGVLAVLQVAYNVPETLPRRRFELTGTRAMAIAEDTMGQTPGGRLELVDADGGARRLVQVPPEEDRSPFLAQVEAFSAALLGGEPFSFPPEGDLATMRLLAAAGDAGPRPGRDGPEARRARRGPPHGSPVPEEWPRPPDLPAFQCTNCGFWQRYFGPPPSCPLCIDARHVLPELGWEFLGPPELDRRVTCRWDEVEPGVWRFRARPALGIGPSGYLVTTPDGNVGFEAAGWYSEEALEQIEALGGIQILSSSHPHAYGALWQLAERFSPEVALQRDDLGWATAFGVTWPYDDRLEVLPGLALLHTGGHFAGHAVLHDARREILFAGDLLKFELAPGDPRTATAVSTHKAFVRQVPLTEAEVRRYRAVLGPLAFSQTFTPFEQARNAGRAEALALLDRQLAGRPFVHPVPL